MSKVVSKQYNAICDPRLMLSAVFGDEKAYIEKETNMRFVIDKQALPVLSLSSILFERLFSEPIIIFGLKEIIGYNFMELFGETVNKLINSGFIDFKPENLVPEHQKEKINKVLNFIADVHESSIIVDSLSGSKSTTIERPINNALVYSRFTGFPFVSSVNDISVPSTSPSISRTRGLFQTLNEIITIELPDLEVKNLDEILQIRSTRGVNEFRELFHDFFEEAYMELDEGLVTNKDIFIRWNRIKNELTDILIQEFRNDIKGWNLVKTGLSIALDIGGFVPGISVLTGSISTLKDSAEFIDILAKKRRAKEFGFLTFLANVRSKHFEQ